MQLQSDWGGGGIERTLWRGWPPTPPLLSPPRTVQPEVPCLNTITAFARARPSSPPGRTALVRSPPYTAAPRRPVGVVHGSKKYIYVYAAAVAAAAAATIVVVSVCGKNGTYIYIYTDKSGGGGGGLKPRRGPRPRAAAPSVSRYIRSQTAYSVAAAVDRLARRPGPRRTAPHTALAGILLAGRPGPRDIFGGTSDDRRRCADARRTLLLVYASNEF